MTTMACVFAGPTLWDERTPPGVTRYGPAAMGSVFRAVEAGYRRIAIVDGFFGNVPSVWHKEILWALASGAEVVGAASMGALRASELCRFGMVGIGSIFRLYRSGRWTDDDEVAIIHATEYLQFRPLSEAMCNIRYTLRNLRRMGTIDLRVEHALVAALKSRHFAQRTHETLAEEARKVADPARAARIVEDFARAYVDVKKRDAQALLAYLDAEPPARPPADWDFPATGHWRKQFKRQLADVPPLR